MDFLGIRIEPDDDCPCGMVATRDEEGRLVPIGFIPELVEDEPED